MLKKILKQLAFLKTKLPITYSIILITLVPLTLIVNTWWNLHSFERDMNFAVREQVLGMQQIFIATTKQQSKEPGNLNNLLTQIQNQYPNLISAAIFKPAPDNKFTVLAATNPETASRDAQSIINSMAWTQEESYLTKTYDSKTQQNVWIAVSTLQNQQNQKIGLINFKISSSPVETIINRTSRDSLIILGISVIIIILLLINHLKFFEQSLLATKLQQIDQMKDDFISIASHELRTPLTAIRSCVSLLEENLNHKLKTKNQKWLDIIDQSITRLNDLVTELLNVSRIEQNRLDFTLSPVNSNQLIAEIVNQLQPTAKEKNLQINFKPTPNLLPVLAHKDRLREVLINLIGNAIKYTPKGNITINQTTEKKNIKITVQDTGLGISPEDQEKLFQKFSRIRTDQTQNISGTGLGLWITKALVQRMKGKIYVDSIVNQGTVFTVVLKTTTPTQKPNSNQT